MPFTPTIEFGFERCTVAPTGRLQHNLTKLAQTHRAAVLHAAARRMTLPMTEQPHSAAECLWKIPVSQSKIRLCHIATIALRRF